MKSRTDWFYLVGAFLLLPLMVSTQSLWIDEAQTASYATVKGFSQWMSTFLSDTKSEGLMPLSMLIVWFFSQFLGTTELALRLPNLIFIGVGIFFMWRIGCRLSITILPLAFATHPFLWQYADEARPYALQIGLGAAVLFFTVEILYSKGSSSPAMVGLLISGWLLSATSLLAGIAFFSVAICITSIWLHSRWRINKRACIAIGFSGALFIPLLIFYLWTLNKGSAGARIWDLSISNIIFASYELMGFQGLGPGRTAFREAARTGDALLHLMLPFLPQLVFLGSVFLASCFVGYLPRRESPRRIIWLSMIGAVFFTVVILFALANVSGFPFWGRHLAPLLPFIVSAAVIWIYLPHRKANRILLSLLILLWLFSSVQTRFSQRFAKDDYRTAALTARQETERGGTVWWAADRAGANYYGLDPSLPSSAIPFSESGRVIFANNREKNLLDQLPEPDLIILSKEDVYDKTGDLRLFIQEKGFQKSFSAAAFTFWHKDPSSAKTIK